jgi:hypothetical protein
MKLPVLFYIYYFILIGSGMVGGFRYRNLPRSLKMLAWLVAYNSIEITLQWILASHNIHNLWLGHFYTLFEIIIVYMIFSSWMKKHQLRLIMALCVSAFVLFWIIAKFTFEPLSHFEGWTAPVSRIIQITFAVFILVDIVKESDVIWTSDPRIWVVAGFFIYATGSLFIFALFSKMLEISPDRLKLMWPLNWILMTISNLSYARAFLCKS